MMQKTTRHHSSRYNNNKQHSLHQNTPTLTNHTRSTFYSAQLHTKFLASQSCHSNSSSISHTPSASTTTTRITASHHKKLTTKCYKSHHNSTLKRQFSTVREVIGILPTDPVKSESKLDQDLIKPKTIEATLAAQQNKLHNKKHNNLDDTPLFTPVNAKPLPIEVTQSLSSFQTIEGVQQQNKIIQHSTIDQIYPKYFLSERPNLWPTVPYVIDGAPESMLSESLPNIPRVGSNNDLHDDSVLFTKMVDFSQTVGAQISPKIGVADFDIARNTLRKHSNPGKAMAAALKAKQQNWGLVTNTNIEQGELLMKVPYTTSLSSSLTIAPHPELTRMVKRGKLPSHLGPEHIDNLNFMISAFRLLLGASDLLPSSSNTKNLNDPNNSNNPNPTTNPPDNLQKMSPADHLPLLTSASFALGLLGNRIADKASAFHHVIQALPGNYPTTHTLNHPRSLFQLATAPRTLGVSETIKFAWNTFRNTTGGDFLNLYAKVIRNHPNILPSNRNMVLQLREMADMKMTDIFVKTAQPFDVGFTPQDLLILFEWGFFTALTRQMSTPFQKHRLGGNGDTINDDGRAKKQIEMNALLKIDPDLMIPTPVDYFNSSPNPNCTVTFDKDIDGEFNLFVQQRLQERGGKLTNEDIDEIQERAPSVRITANRPITSGSQLTISYNPLEKVNITKITPWNEDKVEKILTTSYDLGELFETSLARVPHALDYLKEGTYQRDSSHNTPAVYGFYPKFHPNDDILLLRPAPTEGKKLMPSYDFLSRGFQTILPQEVVLDPKTIQMYYNLEQAEGIINDEKYFPSLSYQDAPLKYILPTFHQGFDMNFRSHQKYRQILNSILQNGVKITRPGDDPDLTTVPIVPIQSLLKTRWFGPTKQLEAICRLYAASGFYPPEPEEFHTKRIDELKSRLSPKTLARLELDPELIKTHPEYDFTSNDSRGWVKDKFNSRLDHVLGLVERKMKEKYKLNEDQNITPSQWLEGFSSPIDEENEYGKLIQFSMLLQHYQDYMVSPIDTEGVSKNNNNNDLKFVISPTLVPDGNDNSNNSDYNPMSRNKIVPATRHGTRISIQSTIPALQSRPMTIRSVAPNEMVESLTMVQSRAEIDRATAEAERVEEKMKKKADVVNNKSLRKKVRDDDISDLDSDAPLDSPFSSTDKKTFGNDKSARITNDTADLNNRKNDGQVKKNPYEDFIDNSEFIPPRNLKDHVSDYYHAIVSRNYDTAMTAIHQYHHMALVTHANKVMATRLGLIDYGSQQGRAVVQLHEILQDGIDKKSPHNKDHEKGKEKKINEAADNSQGEKEKITLAPYVLEPYWHLCDGLVEAELISPTTKILELPKRGSVMGKIKL